MNLSLFFNRESDYDPHESIKNLLDHNNKMALPKLIIKINSQNLRHSLHGNT